MPDDFTVRIPDSDLLRYVHALKYDTPLVVAHPQWYGQVIVITIRNKEEGHTLVTLRPFGSPVREVAATMERALIEGSGSGEVPPGITRGVEGEVKAGSVKVKNGSK